MRRVLATAGAGLLAGLLAGCASSAPVASQTPSLTPWTLPPPPHETQPADDPTPQVDQTPTPTPTTPAKPGGGGGNPGGGGGGNPGGGDGVPAPAGAPEAYLAYWGGGDHTLSELHSYSRSLGIEPGTRYSAVLGGVTGTFEVDRATGTPRFYLPGQ
ncbi:MAG: hypothetical protein FWE61_07245 [Micrococcales bacterium]|nr:hypothetical protein [Micrococcales bacterium]